MPLDRLRKFPTAGPPNDDPASVKGNLSLDQKQLLANILAYHIAHHPGSKVFANEVAGNLKLVEAYIRKSDVPTDGGVKTAVAETVHEVTTGEGMLNVHGSLAGACGVYFLDLATFSTFFCHGLVSRRDASGLSTSMNVNWHAPAMRGTKLRIIGTTLSEGRTTVCRAEAYDKTTGQILISAVHTMVPFEKSSKL
ncbi:hypothetical protein EIP91_004331 [Steccherinum ochraceum]|uniref:Thioesterase domain-containing protein n=1 Tax=Steccherinum ochraceum TaxID=92696 RepID=A0A4R0RHE8_9APHY|nr:hypothetical protein EIP91_004331 [Steccherinum ochraceum]